jgi:hypothetical protein
LHVGGQSFPRLEQVVSRQKAAATNDDVAVENAVVGVRGEFARSALADWHDRDLRRLNRRTPVDSASVPN